MISIRKAKLKDYATLMNFDIHEEQKNFVSGFSELYKKRTQDQAFYVINKDKHSIGFFMIDKAFAKMYTFAEKNELGLQNLVIGKQHQGNGYGVLAMKRFLAYVYGAYSDVTSVCLTVNKKNIAAYKCYEKAGFIDSGTFYYGGKSGPQHIMRKKIG